MKEYKIVYASDELDTAAALNTAASQGWVLRHVTPGVQRAADHYMYAQYVMERDATASDPGASDIEQAIEHLRKARAAFVLAGREDDAEWIATAIDGVKSAQSQIRNGE